MRLRIGSPAKRSMGEAGIVDLLARAGVGQVATAGPDGAPYAVPVCFYYEDGRIYFHCALRGKKLDNIRSDPRVSFSAFEVLGMGVHAGRPCNSWAYYRSVVATGTARILEGDERRMPLRRLAEKYAGGPVAEMPEEAVARTCVVEITIEEASGKENEKKI